MPLVLRNVKGSQLTFNEMDGNFTYLEELSQTGSFTGSFIGDGSGLTNIPGVTPIATGSFATTGSNAFVGNQTISGSLIMSGSISQVGIGTNNTFIGFEAGIARTTGINNTLIGNRAGKAINAGGFNTFIGRSAGTTTTNGIANTAIGTDALFSNQGGTYNTVIGNNALSTATNSSYNIAIGESAAIVTSGSQIVSNPLNSIFIGALTKPQGISDQNTIVIGYSAVGNGDNTVTIGDSNITATYLKGTISGSLFTGSFAGDGSGLTNIPGVTPIATGSFATTGSNQFKAAQTISGSLTVSGSISQVGIGTNNTIVGFEAGRLRTTGMFNTLIGKGAGERATIANSITLVGSNSGNSVTTGNNNTFIGASSGQATTTGDYNVAIGSSALFSNTTGTSNTVIGYSALSQLLAGSSSNIAIGYGAGTLTSDASNLSSSADSIFIGDATYAQNNSQTNQIVIGMYAVGAGSNTTMIGNDNTTATYLKGTLNVTRQILSEVSSSLNFANDTAAAAGGVPLGGLYRNGNAIQIRLV